MKYRFELLFRSFVFIFCMTGGISDLLAEQIVRRVVIGDNVNVRSAPTLKSKVVKQLPILSYVYVLNKKKIAATIGAKKGHWVYVNTRNPASKRRQSSKASTGWIFDIYIGYPRHFKKVRKWRIKEFSYCIGDYCPEFKFTAAGRFTCAYAPCLDGGCPQKLDKIECHSKEEKKEVRADGTVYCIATGNLYRARDVIRLGGPDSHEFLYFNKKKQLCADRDTCP